MRPDEPILLVDDIAEYLDTMELNLPDGCRAIRAASLDEAKAAVARDHPRAALVDVRLSETDTANRDGLALLVWLREWHPRVPVIMISAYREFEYEAESLSQGAEFFIRKPIQPDELMEKVTEVLRMGEDR